MPSLGSSKSASSVSESSASHSVGSSSYLSSVASSAASSVGGSSSGPPPSQCSYAWTCTINCLTGTASDWVLSIIRCGPPDDPAISAVDNHDGTSTVTQWTSFVYPCTGDPETGTNNCPHDGEDSRVQPPAALTADQIGDLCFPSSSSSTNSSSEGDCCGPESTTATADGTASDPQMIADLPAGDYRICYKEGAMIGNPDDTPGPWFVNTSFGSFGIWVSDGTSDLFRAPGDTGLYETAADAEAASAGASATFTWGGGPLYLHMVDSDYSDNSGSVSWCIQAV